MQQHPESKAARAALDAIITASIEGKVDGEVVSWVAGKAYEQFRKEARAQVQAQRERELDVQARKAKEKRRNSWTKVWGA